MKITCGSATEKGVLSCFLFDEGRDVEILRKKKKPYGISQSTGAGHEMNTNVRPSP